MIKGVIESRRWVNSKTGATASIYGAVPWQGDDKSNWSMVVVGWTWERKDGSIGLGRQPATTREEALEIMNKFNKEVIGEL